MPGRGTEFVELARTTVLLVVDAQSPFINVLHEKEAFLRRCAFAIDAARALGMKTVFTEQAPEKLGPTDSRLLARASNPIVFPKRSFSALSAPGIEAYLRDHEIYNLLVCGLETPICIYQTALQSVDEDIDTTFLSDTLGCRREDDGRVAMEAIRKLDCQVLPSETVFYGIIGDSGHPAFRAYSKIVAAYSDPELPLSRILEQTPIESPSKARPSGLEKTAKRPRKTAAKKPKKSRSRFSGSPDDAATEKPKRAKPKRSKPESKGLEKPSAGRKNKGRKAAKNPARKGPRKRRKKSDGD